MVCSGLYLEKSVLVIINAVRNFHQHFFKIIFVFLKFRCSPEILKICESQLKKLNENINRVRTSILILQYLCIQIITHLIRKYCCSPKRSFQWEVI